jgi:hypothetical protein
MALILRNLQSGEKFIIDMHSSIVRIGGVLSQVQEGQWQVVVHCSMSLCKDERIQGVTQWKVLAVVKMKLFHKYLYAQEFHLHTDLSSLTCLPRFMNVEREMTCWVQGPE